MKILISTLIVVLLSGCEQIINAVDHEAVTVDTNAYYSVYQKTSSDSWRIMTSDNINFGLQTTTFTLGDSQSAFGVVFVCPSRRADRPHEVHVYYSTKAELELVDFNCRKSLDEIIEKPLYGAVKGVAIASSVNPDGEFVRLAMSRDVALDAWEAYAVMVRTGTRDVVGLKGKQAADGLVKSEKFLIRRKVQLAASAVPFPLDVDFSGVDFSFYTENFDENSRSIVNITGKNQGDIIQSNLAFLSRNKTVLDLVSSTEDSFSFLPIPLKKYTQTVDDFVNRFEFNPGEGHELLVSANSSTDGAVTRETSKFFTVSEAVVHEMHLPKAISDANRPSLALVNTGDMQRIALKWNKYQDPESGETKIYRWKVEGLAGEPLPDKKPAEDVGQVNWFITVTPGWLNSVGSTDGKYALVIPTHFENGQSDGSIDKDDYWHKEWGFKASTPVSWQMSAVSAAQNNKAEDVIDYLLNRNIGDDLQFSQVYVRSSTEHLATP